MAATEISTHPEQHENTSPRELVHKTLVSEGLDWLTRLQEQPEMPTEEEVDEWSSFMEVVSFYGKAAVTERRNTSPTKPTSQRSNILRRFLEEDLSYPSLPVPSAIRDIRRHPDGVHWVRRELKKRNAFNPDNKGQSLALNRASELFKELENK